jgi:cytidylate kinase
MKRIITVSREHGSGGSEIAARVASLLDWKLLDRALIEEVARLARVTAEEARLFDERVDPWVLRLAKSLWTGSADSFATPPPADLLDGDRMAALTKRAILEAASVGRCVVLGRGAQCALAGREDTLRVFIYAPEADRLERLRARYPDEASTAAALVELDRARNAYVRRYFGCERSDRACFELMINSRIGIEAAVDLIARAAGLGRETA